MFHMPKLEKIWLMIGVGSLILFLIITGVLGVAMGLHPSDGLTTTIEPEKVEAAPPFNEVGVKQVGPNEYVATILSYTFGYDPLEIRIPKNATVHFQMTSKDVIHGFHIPGTPINLMLTPGHITEYTYTFKKAGEYLFLCHEYCGIAHEIMYGKLIVEEEA